jgi:pyrroline-5-carboxylate reductase
MYGNIETTIDNSSAASGSLVFIAVHPQAVKDVLQQICGSLSPDSILVSLAPKLTIARLSTMLNGFDRIARMIPNAPSIIGKGYNPVYFSNTIRPDEKSKILEIFKTLGDCPEVEEEKLEAYAILTAMGPTYFWFQFLELLSLAESFGLSSEQAREGLKKMLCGTIHTLIESGLSTEEVLDLIPVKPLAESEQMVKNIYRNKLEVLYNKLTEKR